MYEDDATDPSQTVCHVIFRSHEVLEHKQATLPKIIKCMTKPKPPQFKTILETLQMGDLFMHLKPCLDPALSAVMCSSRFVSHSLADALLADSSENG